MQLNEYQHPAVTAFNANKKKNKNILNFAETHGCTACRYFKLTADYWCYMFEHQRPLGGCGCFQSKTKRSNK